MGYVLCSYGLSPPLLISSQLHQNLNCCIIYDHVELILASILYDHVEVILAFILYHHVKEILTFRTT